MNDIDTQLKQLSKCDKSNDSSNELHNWVRKQKVTKEEESMQFAKTGSPYILECVYCKMAYDKFINKVKELYASKK